MSDVNVKKIKELLEDAHRERLALILVPDAAYADTGEFKIVKLPIESVVGLKELLNKDN